MFLEHKYIGKYEQNQIKVEFYDTGKKGFFSKTLAYQVFADNQLVYETEDFITYLRFNPLDCFQRVMDNLLIEGPELKQIEYIPEFEAIA